MTNIIPAADRSLRTPLDAFIFCARFASRIAGTAASLEASLQS